MTHAYALAVHIDSYEYSGSYYLLGDDHDTPKKVLANVAADHILAMSHGGPGLCQHVLNLLELGVTVPKVEFEDATVDTRCTLDTDPYYDHYWFSFEDANSSIELRRPMQSDIEEVASNLDEYANPDDGFERDGRTIDYDSEE